MKYIFLDIDNTLLDFDAYVQTTMKEGFAHFGLRPYEPWMFDVFTTENNKLWHQIELATLTFEELKKIRWNTIFAALDIQFDGIVFEKYFRDALFTSAIPMEGAMELLEALHDKYVLCVASNGPYNQQVNRLTISDMLKYFKHIFVSEGVGVSKPAYGFYEYAFKELEKAYGEPVDPKECLMFGDSMTSDMAGGEGAGMVTCFYNRKGVEPDYTRIDYAVDKLTDLLKLPEL